MDIRTYRARSIHEAIELVRRDLGPDASVLHTRELPTGLLGRWLSTSRTIEVTASAEVPVPSRLPPPKGRAAIPARAALPTATGGGSEHAPATEESAPPRDEFADDVRGRLNRLQDLVEELYRKSPQSGTSGSGEPGPAWWEMRQELAASDVAAAVVDQWLTRLQGEWPHAVDAELDALRLRLAESAASRLALGGSIRLAQGQCRKVALVGPTGVGKTTTLAKLAAQFHLREQKRVALVTIDTFRIAAVEQLRTYAEIIDLPMHIVTTPREMRSVISKLTDMDLVLIDSAGRSPADELKLKELRAFLAEGQADEVHLVLSATTSGSSLQRAVARFSSLAPTAIVLSKVDEAPAFWHVLPGLEAAALPLSYLTHGQNVPDDFAPADAENLVRRLAASPSACR